MIAKKNSYILIDHQIIQSGTALDVHRHKVRITRDLSAVCDVLVYTKGQAAIAYAHHAVESKTGLRGASWDRDQVVAACTYAEEITLARDHHHGS
jgi:hypothetical protein